MRRSGVEHFIALLPKRQPKIVVPRVMLLAPHSDVVGHAANSGAMATAADWFGTIFYHEAHEQLEAADKKRILQSTVDYLFDSTTGVFMATPATLPTGIASRVPASGDTPSAEVLALLAGVDAKTADLIRRNLMNQIEYDEMPPGDVLLGLSQK
jgi:hypothetical protein